MVCAAGKMICATWQNDLRSWQNDLRIISDGTDVLEKMTCALTCALACALTCAMRLGVPVAQRISFSSGGEFWLKGALAWPHQEDPRTTVRNPRRLASNWSKFRQ